MTVRQVFYQLTTRGLIAKTEGEYGRTVGRLLAEMRRASDIPFDWILGSPVFPELWELDPWSSWLSPGPRRCFRNGFPSCLLARIKPLDDLGDKEQLLIGRRGVTLAPLAKHHSLQQPQLLGSPRQLLLASSDDFLLLRDDRLLLCISLLQFTNPLLAGHQLIGDR
jgi:hypothetical protein